MKMEDTPHKLLSMIMYCFPSPCRTVQVANKNEQFAYFCCPFSPGRVWSCRPRPSVRPPAIPPLQRTGLCRPAASCHEERKSGLTSPFVSFPRPSPRLPPGFWERCRWRRTAGQYPRSRLRLREGTNAWDDAPKARSEDGSHAGRRAPGPGRASAG